MPATGSRWYTDKSQQRMEAALLVAERADLAYIAPKKYTLGREIHLRAMRDNSRIFKSCPLPAMGPGEESALGSPWDGRTAGRHTAWWRAAEDGSAGASLQVGSSHTASTRNAAQLHTCVHVCKHICGKINRLSSGLAGSSELVFLEGSHTKTRAGCST